MLAVALASDCCAATAVLPDRGSGVVQGRCGTLTSVYMVKCSVNYCGLTEGK